MKIERLGIRALYDYTRRSQFTYLALRYAMEASAVRKDRWATEIAPDIVRRELPFGYHTEFLFKEHRNGRYKFRTLGSPGSNEALAEAALLDACSKAGGPFSKRSYVYSYRLAKGNTLTGSFQPYFDHFKNRQRAIGRCCRKNMGSMVFYADIRNFYPSLSRTRVKNLWKAACAEARLSDNWMKIGESLIERQRTMASKGLMVGPMFSHLLADLALRDFDTAIIKGFPKRYFRYVDDIAIVLPASRIKFAKKRMVSLLKSTALKLHPKKFAEMSARDWAVKAPWQGKPSSIEERDKKWIALIDRVKCYLLKKPDEFELLSYEFRNANLRIPLPRYRAAVEDLEYRKRLRKRMQSQWFLKYVHRLTIKKVLNQALKASQGYLDEFSEHWTAYGEITGAMEQKWHVTKLKGILGKLTMLAPEELIPSVIQLLDGRDEFASNRAILTAIKNNDVSELVSFGGGVCGAAGQVLATRNQEYICRRDRWSTQARQGYATLCLMGVKVNATLPLHVKRSFEVKFVMGDYKPGAWRKIEAPFPRDIVAISKNVNLERNQHLIQSPLNPDNEWVLLSDELNMPAFSP